MSSKFLSAFLVSIFLSPLFGDEINWIGSFNKAKELAKSENKLIMLMITQPNCKACDFMKYATFENEGVVDEVNNHYIPIILDKSELIERIFIRGTPTFKFYTPQGKRLKYTLIGGINYKKFRPKLENLRNRFFKIK